MLHYLKQNRSQFKQGNIRWIIVPRAYLNAVLWLICEIRGYVVDDDCFGKLAADHAQIFQVDVVLAIRVLPVQTVRYQVLSVQLI